MVEQRELAEWEVGLLGIPPSLTEPEFNNWVTLSLLASPFVKSIMDMADRPRETAWETLALEWSITKAEIERSITTAENWLSYFNQGSNRIN